MIDTVFFWLSKLVWLIISPDSLLVILIVSCWLCYAAGFNRAGRKILNITCAAVLLIAFLPIGDWLIYPLESRYETNPTLPEHIDGIVVLGGAADAHGTALWQQTQLGPAAERLTTFLTLSRLYPEARALFTGGSGTLFNQQYKEADIIDEFFAGLGYSGEKLLFENESRNTYENAVFGKKLIQPKFGENWILITSAFHMPRSMGSFCRQGWPLIPYPVDHGSQKGNLLRVDFDFRGNLSGLSTAIHEWVGLLAYYLTDKTSRLFPGPTDFCS